MSGSSLKDAVVACVRSQGFRVPKATQGERDIRLELAQGGTRATLMAYGVTSVPLTWLQFVRLDVGAVDGPPTRWGVVEGGGGGVQVALGPTWTTVGAGFSPGKYPIASRLDKLEPLFAVARRLHPGGVADDELEREGDWPLRALEDVRLRPTRYLAPTGGGLLATGAAATAATVALGGLAATLLWVPAVVATVVGGAMLGTAGFARRALLRSNASGKEVHEVLTGSGAFEQVDPVAAGTADHLSVVTRQDTDYMARQAKGSAALFGGRSREPRLEARVRIDQVRWPAATLPACRIIPDCWATVELTGAPEALALAPTWHRGIVGGSRIGWLFDGEELAAGKLADLFARLAAALNAAQSGPYR